MKITRIILPPDLIPAKQQAAEAVADRMSGLVRRHLRDRNASRPANQYGLPKTNYYDDAAESVTTEVSGNVASVVIDKEGVALHYEGGTVYPKKKALAVPIDPAVAGIWPSEANALANEDEYALIWPKNSAHGFIKDVEQNQLLWLLIPKATIPADPTVLPTEDEFSNAAMDAVWDLMDAMGVPA